MGVCNRQPLAKSKGVHREVESEGSWRQSPGPRNTNTIRQTLLWTSLPNKAKSKDYTDIVLYMVRVDGMKVYRLTMGDLTDVRKH